MLTSNEWMQRAGELEAEVERLRESLRTAQGAVGLYKDRESDLWEENERLRRIEEAARYLVDAYDREPVGGAAVAQLRAVLEEGS